MWVHMDVWIRMLCVHMGMWICVLCVHMGVWIRVLVRLRLTLGIFFSYSPSDVILRQELSLNLELDWLAREPQGLHLP